MFCFPLLSLVIVTTFVLFNGKTVNINPLINIKQTLDQRSWARRREPFRGGKRPRVLGEPGEVS